jgi:hypothetical protein
VSIHEQSDENVVQIKEQVHGNTDVTTGNLAMMCGSHLDHVKILYMMNRTGTLPMHTTT